MSKTAKGTMLTLVAGVAWGLSGTSGQYLMAHGFPVLVLTNVRLLIAGVLLISYMVLTNRKKLFEMLKDQEAMMSLVLFALLGLLLNQFSYLKSIYESNAGTATVLQYVCPVGILAYTFQIYFDFSGYSDMAIGIALLLGFRFNINFDSPYQSGNITEFWRRWHISLSSWLRDYLYIPLGGNRKGQIRTYVNLFLTMLLGGLWHGAALRFVLWGAIHGVALALHKLYMQIFGYFGWRRREPLRWQRFVGQIITFHLVCFAWIFFRADSMETACAVITQIKDHFTPEVFLQFVVGYKNVLLLLLIGYLLHFTSHKQELRFREWITELSFLKQALLFIGVIFLLIQIRSADAQPFIYFNF